MTEDIVPSDVQHGEVLGDVWLVLHDDPSGYGGAGVVRVCSSLTEARETVRKMGGEIERYAIDGEPWKSVPEKENSNG